jgi:hypothetical protein
LNKKPWVVAFIRSLLHQKGLARYLCIAHALASMLHILIEASFHMCVPYVHWHEDGGSWGSGELTQWLSNRHVFQLKWPESILAYCYCSVFSGVSEANGAQVKSSSSGKSIGTGDSCECWHELQPVRSGKEGTTPRIVFINMHSCQLHWGNFCISCVLSKLF